MKPKPVHYKIAWGCFAPDGYLQFRSIAPTKKLSREYTPAPYSEKTYKDYEDAGFFWRKIKVDIKILNFKKTNSK